MYKKKKIMVDMDGGEFINKVIEASLTHTTVGKIFKQIIGSINVVLPDYKIYRLFLNVHMTSTQYNNLKMILESSCGEDLGIYTCREHWCIYGGEKTARYFRKINDWRTDCLNDDLYYMRRENPNAFKEHVDKILMGSGMIVNCTDQKKIRRHIEGHYGYTLYQYIMIVPEDEELVLQQVRNACDNNKHSRSFVHDMVVKTKFKRLAYNVNRYCVENGIE